MELTINLAWIKCFECGATGPHSLDNRRAVDLWNGECVECGYTGLVTTGRASNRNQTKLIDL